MRNAFATLTLVDRQAHPGDSVTIEIEGSSDGEAIDGLTASDYVYEVGSGSVVPEMDEQLTGASAGDRLVFSAVVPGNDEQMIDFVVAVKAVNEKVMPEANDEWAASSSEFATLDELRADIARRMNLVKRVQANMAMRDETVKALVELVDGDIPDSLVEQELDRRLQDLNQRLAQQGADLNMYMQAMGQTRDDLVGPMRESAVEAVKADLALRSVAASESIQVSDEEIATEIDNLARRFNMKPKVARRNLEANFQMPLLIADIRKAKAVTWLTEHATAVDADGKQIDRALLEVAPNEFDDAEESAEVLGLDTDVDFDDHEGHDHAGHDHSGHNH